MSVNATVLIIDATIRILNTAIRYNQLHKEAALQGREISVEEVKALEEQTEADQKEWKEVFAEIMRKERDDGGEV